MYCESTIVWNMDARIKNILKFLVTSIMCAVGYESPLYTDCSGVLWYFWSLVVRLLNAPWLNGNTDLICSGNKCVGIDDYIICVFCYFLLLYPFMLQEPGGRKGDKKNNSKFDRLNLLVPACNTNKRDVHLVKSRGKEIYSVKFRVILFVPFPSTSFLQHKRT